MAKKVTKKKIILKPASASLEPIYQVWACIAIVWFLYRYFVHVPEWVDELIIKPAIFVLPVLWFVAKKERRTLASLGITKKNFFPALYTGLGFGMLFALEGLVSNYIKYGKVNINPIAAFGEYGMLPLLGLSLATAFSEEVLNRGFLFQRIYERTGSVLWGALKSTLLFMALHVPILVTATHLEGMTLVIFFITTFILGVANSLLYLQTGSLVAPILVHLFWNMTVALYL